MLSAIDLMNYLPGVNIIQYHTLSQINKIEDILGKKGCIILYPVKSNTNGHWVSIHLNPKDNKIYFFDSYSGFIDTQLKYRCRNMYWKKSWSNRLSKLLYDSKHEIDYNEFQLQSNDRDDTNCGYWCLARLKLNDLTAQEFYNVFNFNNLKKSGKAVVNFVDSSYFSMM